MMLLTPVLVLTLVASVPDGQTKGPLVPVAPAGFTDAGPRRFALLVGIDGFDDERFPDLRYASKDAQRFGQALQGFDHVQVLTTTKETARASILDALDALVRRANRPQDTAVLYLSSHGSLVQKPGADLQRYLVTRDSRLHLLRRTGISVEALLSIMDQSPARAKAVFLATCHSGQGKSKFSDEVASALRGRKAAFPELHAVSEATMIFTAAAFGEAARESEELGHDVYTHFLLQAFQHGDRDGDGVVTASEAHDYARAKTYDFTGGTQRPTAEISMLGEDPVILAGRRTKEPKPTIYSYAPSSEGIVLSVDGQTKGVLPGGVSVSPGRHEIQLTDRETGASLYEGEIDVGVGQRLEVSSLIPPPPTFRLWVGPSFFAPLGANLRSEFVPAGFGAAAGLAVRDWVFRRSLVGVQMDVHLGSGSAEGFEETVPFSSLTYGAAGRFGYALGLGEAVELELTGTLGWRRFERSFDTGTFRSDQGTSALVTGFNATLQWAVAPWADVGVRSEVGVFLAEFSGDLAAHPYVSLGLSIDFRL